MPRSVRKQPAKPMPPCKRGFSPSREAGTIHRFLRRKYYMRFRKRYVEEMLKARQGVCGGHGCCDLSFFHRGRKCLDCKDRTKCLLWDRLPRECVVYPFDEKDKIPETRAYCNFHWDKKDVERMRKRKL